MKYLITILLALALSVSASAKVYGSKSVKDTLVTKEYYQTTTGKWVIIINKKSGSCYYYAKTRKGTIAKRYCPKEVSAEVSKKYNIKYSPKTK